MGSNLCGLKFNFLFAKKLVWFEYERGRVFSKNLRSAKNSEWIVRSEATK